MIDRIVVKRDTAGEWRFAAVVASGGIVARSDAFVRKIDAERAAQKLYPGIPIRDA